MLPIYIRLSIIAVLLAVPSAVAGQFATQLSEDSASEQTMFVNVALERIVGAHAQEEGLLAGRLSAAQALVLTIESESQSLTRAAVAVEREIGQRRRVALQAAERWKAKFGSEVRMYSNVEDEYRVRQTELAEAEARLTAIRARQVDLATQMAAAQQALRNAELEVSVARGQNAEDRAELGQAVYSWIQPVPLGAIYTVPKHVRWAQLSSTITQLAAENNALATVTFRSLPERRVMLFYQTVDERHRERPPHRLNNPTQTVSRLPIGEYHIWYEENGVSRSDRERVYKIDEREETVTIVLP